MNPVAVTKIKRRQQREALRMSQQRFSNKACLNFISTFGVMPPGSFLPFLPHTEQHDILITAAPTARAANQSNLHYRQISTTYNHPRSVNTKTHHRTCPDIQHHPLLPSDIQPSPPWMPQRPTRPARRLTRAGQQTRNESRVSACGHCEAQEAELGGKEGREGEVEQRDCGHGVYLR